MPDSKASHSEPDPIGGSSPLSSPGGSPPSGPRQSPSHVSDPFGGSSPLSSLDGDRTPSPEPSNPDAPKTPVTLKQRAMAFSDTQTNSTPIRHGGTRNPTTSTDTAKEQQKALKHEFGDTVDVVSEAFARTLFLNFDAEKIEAFLRESKLYSTAKKRWSSIPSTVRSEHELYDLLVAIIQAIIEYFNPTPVPGVTRKALNTNATGLTHDNGRTSTRPDISIKGSGLSFETPEHANSEDDLGYANLASPIDAKLDEKISRALEHLAQLGVYSRQIFLQQPNRVYVCSMIITEKRFRFVHFDRSGAYVSPYFDLHVDAALFVRYILGLTSFDEEDLGLDTSVQWQIDQATGKKISGTITINEYDPATNASNAVVYELNMKEPPFVVPGIRGRGTVGWHAFQRGTGQAVLIKDSWRTAGRLPESDYLEAAREAQLPGVAELLAFQDNCASTIDYRPLDFENDRFFNRVKLRIAVKKYGTSIWYFRSRLELLQALLDAIVGHRKLFEIGILHRDVSMQNILFGPPDAPVGYRGFLVDLDMSIWANRPVSEVSKDQRTAFILYQSCSVLANSANTFPQDYMDDLESHLYVYSHLVYGFEKPGVWKKELPRPIGAWMFGEAEDLAVAKAGFFAYKLKQQAIPQWWGPHCIKLLDDFRVVMKEVVTVKDEIRESTDMDAEERREAYKELAGSVDQHYSKIVEAFETAIEALEKEGPAYEELLPYPKLNTKAAFKAAVSCNHFPLSSVVTELPYGRQSALQKAYTQKSTSGARSKRGSQEVENDDRSVKRNCHTTSSLRQELEVQNDTIFPQAVAEGNLDDGSEDEAEPEWGHGAE